MPALGNKEVDKITTRDISSFFDSILNRKKRYKYLKSIKGISIKTMDLESFFSILSDLSIPRHGVHIHDIDIIRQSLIPLLEYYADEEIVQQYLSKHAKYYYITKTTTQGTVNKCKALISHMYNTAMLWDEPDCQYAQKALVI